MALKLNFREITPEDTRILRMVALRNGKVEDYLCCDVTNEDGVTQTTWYSKADVALWGEDYIRAHTTMEYSDYTGWIISLDMEPWNDAQASPTKQPAMCLSSKKYTGKVNAYEIKNGAESRTHFEWAWTETMPLRYATTGITGT